MFKRNALGLNSAVERVAAKITAVRQQNIIGKADAYYEQGEAEKARAEYQRIIHVAKRKKPRILPTYAFQRAGEFGYHSIDLPKYKIAYFPIPKNACTSLKWLFYELIYGAPFDSQHPLGTIHKFFRGGTMLAHNPNYADRCKVVVIRDPIQRFISAYRNRILYHQDVASLYAEKGLSEAPEINQFVDDLEFYMRRSRVTNHHFGLQSLYLTGDFSFFDKIYPIEQLGELVAFLSDTVGRPLELPRKQAGGPKVTLQDLSPESFAKLLAFYDADYQFLGDYYSADHIKALYAA
ncbi:sulfotransferase family 2 domain-containing protein [Marinicaulis aureus]|uniref:Sulfotransferase family 2 domain-containing protein n=1 Tax=Hyphococcus aureus TaxID=2666033 RepID=A0ABW1KUT4_9PROT